MDDLISRQAAIDAIERTDWYHINNNGELVHGANSKYDVPLYKAEDIYKTINGLPSVQRWIPVSERLPEKSGKYLVTVQNGNVYAGTFDAYSGRFQCAAVAWQPLPEPYKDGDVK